MGFWYKQMIKIKPKHWDYIEQIVLYLNTRRISKNATLYIHTALHDTKHSKHKKTKQNLTYTTDNFKQVLKEIWSDIASFSPA